MSSTTSQHHWGLPCTVSAATYLFPPDLNTDLDTTELADKPGFKSCFLRTHLDISTDSAVRFAKMLHSEAIFTVGDFLKVECDWKSLHRLVTKLDRYLAQFPDLPENRHAAPGTCAGCAVALA